MNYAFYLDIERCSGCQACSVACMDQNDIEIDEKGIAAWRRVFKIENQEADEVKISFISLSCMHCQDAPCIMGCPTGAISKDNEYGMVVVNQGLCIGCCSCSIACPFGIPRFGKEGKMQKCNMCSERVKHSLEPACVRTCPTKALKFGPANELGEEVEERIVRKLFFSNR